MKKELYLILDAKTDYEELFLQAKQALMGGVDKIQLANAIEYSQNELARLIELCHNYRGSLLFHEDIEYAIKNDCDGIHFDKLPLNLDRTTLPEDFIIGVTVGNDENIITKAVEFGVDYISFCSLYPSQSVENCEIVNHGLIRTTANKYDIPIYVAGGIDLKKISELKNWPIAGVVMISEIIKADDIEEKVRQIKDSLQNDTE